MSNFPEILIVNFGVNFLVGGFQPLTPGQQIWAFFAWLLNLDLACLPGGFGPQMPVFLFGPQLLF